MDVGVTIASSPNVDVTLPDPANVNVYVAKGDSYSPGDPMFALVRNATGATLTKGTVVYTSGANGTHVQVTKALATADATSARTMGFVSADIANGSDGYVIISGYLEGINTAGTTAGQIVYLSGTTAGAWTTTKNLAPTHLVYLGVITRVNANNGSIYVHPQNGYELDEIHDVQIVSPTNSQVLAYDSASGLWKNKTVSGGGGSSGTVTSITATSPLTGGTITDSGSIGLDQTALAITPSQVTGTAVITTDSRLSDARTPTTHASSHASAGSDPITVSPSQVTGTAVITTDSRLSDARTPSDASVTDAKIATTLSPSKITGTAVITSDSRLSDTRTPTDASVTDAKIATTLSPSKITGTAVITSDSRLSDARTPTAHAASHASGGSDQITIAESQVTNLTTDLAAKAPLASPTFTGIATIPTSNTTSPYLIQPTPTAKSATGTLAIAEMLTYIITVTSSTAVTLTLPTGTLTDAGIQSGALPTNGSFDWCIINLGSTSGTVAIAAGTGHTYVGTSTAVPINTSAQYRTRKTATNTFVTYRIG